MRILTIEDDAFFQKFYAEKLRENGFEVEIAHNGEEGLVKARSTKPDIILLDIIMPIKDGFEVLEEIKKDKELNKIPVLVFSTLGQESDVQKAIELGAAGYVNKTLLDFGMLLNQIHKVTHT